MLLCSVVKFPQEKLSFPTILSNLKKEMFGKKKVDCSLQYWENTVILTHREKCNKYTNQRCNKILVGELGCMDVLMFVTMYFQ